VIIRRHGLDLELLAPDASVRLQVTARDVALCCAATDGKRAAIQAAIGHAQAAGRALQLAAGGLGQRAGVEQQHHAGAWRQASAITGAGC
jgi:hypothetical protein